MDKRTSLESSNQSLPESMLKGPEDIPVTGLKDPFIFNVTHAEDIGLLQRATGVTMRQFDYQPLDTLPAATTDALAQKLGKSRQNFNMKSVYVTTADQLREMFEKETDPNQRMNYLSAVLYMVNTQLNSTNLNYAIVEYENASSTQREAAKQRFNHYLDFLQRQVDAANAVLASIDKDTIDLQYEFRGITIQGKYMKSFTVGKMSLEEILSTLMSTITNAEEKISSVKEL